MILSITRCDSYTKKKHSLGSRLCYNKEFTTVVVNSFSFSVNAEPLSFTVPAKVNYCVVFE